MRFVLVGPGALGCLLASVLAKAINHKEDRFILLDHNTERARQLTSQGIIYQRHDQSERVALPVISSPAEIGHADVIILCVKSYDVPASLQFCRPLLQPATLLLFLQNGISHLGASGLTWEASPVYGTTTEGATLLGRGSVRHAGKGLTQFGFLEPADQPTTKLLEKAVAIFNRGGLKASITDDILSRLWTKLMVNVGINGLTAILDCPNGELLSRAGIPERMTLLVAEAAAVAAASNIQVPENSLDITREVCRKTAENISSMLQDVRAGRRTEIDAINGAVVAAGERLGIPTPENRLLVDQIKQLEEKYSGSTSTSTPKRHET